VIPNDRAIETAVLTGERLFADVGCASCHVETLPLDRRGWWYSEPNPYNPPGNRQLGDAAALSVDLTRGDLPLPRLRPTAQAVVSVPAYTDLKVYELCDSTSDPSREPLDMHELPGSAAFFAGNCRFVTRRLWGAASTPPYFHHGKFATLREAIAAHGGEAADVRAAFHRLSSSEQDAVIEFLKTLQILPPGTAHLIVDEHGKPKSWPPKGALCRSLAGDCP
jgi:cytochrome c peroxidase